MNHQPVNEAYREIGVLHRMLTEACIPHEYRRHGDGWQVLYTVGRGRHIVCSAIEHSTSLGSEEDRIEIRGLLTGEENREDSVKGYLTAQEVFRRICADAKTHGRTYGRKRS